MAEALTVRCMRDALERASLLLPSAAIPREFTANAVVVCYDEKNFLDKIKGMVLPVIGIVYEGVMPRPEPSPAKASHRIGVASEMRASFVVACQSDVFVQADFKTPTMNVLGEIRRVMRDRQGPSGHFWEFKGEKPAVLTASISVYVQTWALPLILMDC